MNREIEQLLLNEAYREAWTALSEYEVDFPLDADIDTYRFMCLSGVGETEAALQYACSAVQKQPYVADAHYNCGYAYQLCGKYFQAYEQYTVAKELAMGENPASFSIEELDGLLQQMLNMIMSRANNGEIDDIEADKIWIGLTGG